MSRNFSAVATSQVLIQWVGGQNQWCYWHGGGHLQVPCCCSQVQHVFGLANHLLLAVMVHAAAHPTLCVYSWML